jgi:hypothetical protein
VPYPVAFVQDNSDGKLGVGVAHGDVASIKSLRATVNMTKLFAAALSSDPSQDGAEPWQAVIDAAQQRNTIPDCKGVAGMAGGTGHQIVRDSRSDYHVSAARAAVSALSRARGQSKMQETVSFAAMARDMSPVCLDKCVAKLGEERGREALENALRAGDTDSPTRIKDVCMHFAEAQAWHPELKQEIESHPLFGSIILTSGSILNQCRAEAAKLQSKHLAELLSGHVKGE